MYVDLLVSRTCSVFPIDTGRTRKLLCCLWRKKLLARLPHSKQWQRRRSDGKDPRLIERGDGNELLRPATRYFSCCSWESRCAARDDCTLEAWCYKTARNLADKWMSGFGQFGALRDKIRKKATRSLLIREIFGLKAGIIHKLES